MQGLWNWWRQNIPSCDTATVYDLINKCNFVTVGDFLSAGQVLVSAWWYVRL